MIKKNFVEVKNLNFSYENNNKFYLENLNFSMSTGEIIFLKGESGIGKSTLINLICGLIRLHDGKITCNNNDISQNFDKWQDGIAYVSQGSRLLDDSIINNITFTNQVNQASLDRAITISNSDKFINEKDKN